MSSILIQGDFNYYTVSEHGMTFFPETPRETWLEVIRKLCGMYEGAIITAEKTLMLLADALNFGQERYGEEFAAAIDGTRQALGLSPKTIANAQWVYGKIESSRRRDGLTLGHYSILAALPGDDQDRFMDQALKHHMTVTSLKQAVAISHPKTKRGKTRKSKEKPIEETSATILQKLIAASNWFSEHDPIQKMKGPLSKLCAVSRRKWKGK